MFAGLLGGVCAQALEAINAEQKIVSAMTNEQRADYLAKKDARNKDYFAHRRALEIAEASRPRNFWGK